MDWMIFLEQVFELIVYPVLGAVGILLTYLINAKINELKQKANNDTARKYLDMLNDTVKSAVLATTQTYVDSLKQQGKFDEEAQKTAFKLTYDAVVKVLSDEATKYIASIVGDLDSYITTKIEAEIRLGK
jgi:hypothetical protein